MRQMGSFYNRFLEKNIDLAPLGVLRRDDNSPYYCTPQGARIIGWAGVDGIHYCFVRGFGETVFSVSPMEISPNFVRPLAASFKDFLRLLLACGDAGMLEQAWQWTEEDFERALESAVPDKAALETLEQLRDAMKLTPMEQPWACLHQLQDSFDYSKIRYTEDFYDPDMNENAPLPEWAVYYDGTIYGHSGRDRAGKEIPVNREFQFAGRRFLVPAVYACARGLVVDFCMRVEMQAYRRFEEYWYTCFEGRDGEDLNRRERLLLEMKNPLLFDFSPEVTVNGKRLKREKGSGICFVPGDPSEAETRFLAEHYRLDESCAWSLTRACFPWKSARRPEIRSLVLTMNQEPVRLPGEAFEASVPGQQIHLQIPGHPLTLTVEDLEEQILDTAMMSTEELEYPACYTMLTYTVSPTPEPETFSVQDLAYCDQPRPRQKASGTGSSCEAEALAIIGGADGPTAIVVGAPQSDRTLAACSAPHFEPAEKIQWYPVLRVTEFEPADITLL